jgi:predicted branched-subunit amino acid permease
MRQPLTYTTAGALRGFARAQGLAPGVFVYGAAFGLLASQANLSALEAVLMSAFIYSGTAQLASITFITHGFDLHASAWAALVGAIFLLNARYLLYSAALRPWLESAPTGPVYGSLFVLGDNSWALAMREHAKGEMDGAFVLGSGLAMYLPWSIGTLVGTAGGQLVPNPAVLGLDFFLIAFAAAMGASMAKARSDMAVGLAALVAALAVDRIAPGGWAIVAAGLAGGAIAYLRHRETAEDAA